MDPKIGSALIGATAAIITLVVSQIISRRKEKEIFDIKKLDEIVECISRIQPKISNDFTHFIGLEKGKKEPTQIDLELDRLEFLIKIYHPKLTNDINKLLAKTGRYFSHKVKIVNLNLSKNKLSEKEESNVAQELSDLVGDCCEELKLFRGKFIEYGKGKVNP